MEEKKRSYYKKKFFFSIRERILLHLSAFQIYENELEAPDELTQFGIAEVVLAGRSTCSKLLQEMEEKGLLYGRRAHVPSGKIRRTVYFLTPRGQLQAEKIRKRAETTLVKVRTLSGDVKKLKVIDIPDEVPVHAPLVDVVCHISRGVFDVQVFVNRMKTRREKVAYLHFMPRLRHFFDRQDELQGIDNWLNSKKQKILVLHGLPGVGVTTLAGKVATDLRDERSVFWYSIHEWSTPRDVVQQIGEFLSRLNRKELLMHVQAHEALEMTDALFMLESGLQGLKALMVFDDYDKAAGQLDAFFSSLKDLVAAVDGPKVIVTGRSVPKFYDRRDVKVKDLVAELQVEGLDEGGTARILSLNNIPEPAFMEMYKKTKGHPLFLELIRGPEFADTRDIDKFLEEELFSRLLDVERRVLGLASVFRKPIHVDALFLDNDVDFVVITGLSDRSLLKESTPKMFDVHDLVRRFFYERLPPPRRRRYHSWAARFYTSKGAPEDLVEAQYHLLKAGRIDAAAKAAATHGGVILHGGRREEFTRILDRLKGEELQEQVRNELRLLEGRIKDLEGKWDEALAHYEAVVKEARRLGVGGLEAEARRRIGSQLLSRGEYANAEAQLVKALELYRKARNLDGQAEAYYGLGFIRNLTSEFMEAYREFRKGMHCVERTGNKAITAKLLYAFGVNYGQRGNYSKSVSYKLRSMNILEEIRDIYQLAKVYIGLGMSYQELEDFDEALRYYEKAIEYSRLTGDHRTLAYAMQNASSIHLGDDNYDQAAELIDEASAIFQRLGERRKIAWSLLYRGFVDFSRGNSDAAVESWSNGMAQLREMKDMRGIALFSLTLARLHADDGSIDLAIAYLKEAEAVAKDIDHEVILDRVADERAYVNSVARSEQVIEGTKKARVG